MSNPSLILSQKLHLAQKVFLATSILNKPITAIDRTIDAIIENPDIVNSGAQHLQAKSGGARSSNYSGLLERLIGNENGSGADQFVPSAGNAIIANSDEHVIAQPDITYVVMGYGDFNITHSEHFKKMEPGLRVLQVPRNVQPFLKWLINERNWIADSLLQAYVAIGKKQAGFLVYLDPQQLAVLPRARLPSETGTNYSPSIYSRLLQGRSVRIESPNGTAVLPVAFLLPIQSHIIEYEIIPRMNAVFEKEFKQKRAYSDSQIGEKIGTIARRTVTKYRLSAEIPNKSERQAQYKQGIPISYKVISAIESYLPSR